MTWVATTVSYAAAELLREARKALAKGDAQRATLLAGQAKQLGLEYPLNADSPDKVEALIRSSSTFAQGPAAGMDAGVYTLAFAQFLMDQSIGLLGYTAFDEAQQLAQQAKDLQASYSQFDRTPDQVLVQIAAARRQAAGDPAAAACSGAAHESGRPCGR